jgi:hypothetical protein
MSRVNATLSATLIAAAFAAPAIAATPYRCDAPQGIGERQACAKAAEGATELRRFVERTRMIYGLYFWDFVRPDEAPARTAAAADETKTAATAPVGR